jgi:hypothetical protein
MGFGGSPPTPVVSAVTPAPPPPQTPQKNVQAAGQATAQRAQSNAALSSTIVTGPQGLAQQSSTTAQKKLTGE